MQSQSLSVLKAQGTDVICNRYWA